MEKLDCEACFIGGDFNLNYSKAEHVIQREEAVIGRSDAVDYMIGSPKNKFSAAMVTTKKYIEFNHAVVYISLMLTLETLKAAGNYATVPQR